jgi:pimeloyl-ACP methyl ester carboxylesterase
MPEPRKIALWHELYGAEDAPVVVMIHGLGGQLTDWPKSSIDVLVSAGFRVLIYDQRDSGRSTHLSEAGAPDILSISIGRHELAPYTLADMADDLLELLDQLGIDRVHLVGVSMGAMVAQQFLLAQPTRVRSIVSMLGTTGRRGVGGPSELALAALLNPNPAEPLEVVVACPRSATERQAILDRISRGAERLAAAGTDDPYASVRQLGAILASGDRSSALAALDGLPALVVHGTIDPLVDVSGGFDTFRVLKEARLLLFGGLGHDLPTWCWDRLAPELLTTIQRAKD